MRRLGCTTLVFGMVVFAIPLALILGARSTPQHIDVQNLAAAAGIPPRMLAAYTAAVAQIPREAPKCVGMLWEILAGIAMIESQHAAGHTIADNGDITPRIIGPRLDGSGVGENYTAVPDTDGGRWDNDTHTDHAVGPFQFLPSTWEGGAARDGNGDGVKDPHNAYDAALAAAVYLCGNGRNLNDTAQLEAAVYSYNHSHSYVAEVTSWITRYTQLGATAATTTATGTAATVLHAALAQQGVPYSWGGGEPDGPTYGACCSPGGTSGTLIRGFDCSGLTQYAFAQAHIALPRTADAQARAGRRIPTEAGIGALHPGDLVFFAYSPGSDSTIYHVGIYLGAGRMINAARPGTTVRTEPVWDHGFAGGARLP